MAFLPNVLWGQGGIQFWTWYWEGTQKSMAANGHTNCVSLPTLKQPLALPMVVYGVFGQTFCGVKVGLIYTYEAKRGSKKIWSQMARNFFSLHPNVGSGPHHCCWWLWHLWGQSGFSIKCLPSRRPKNIWPPRGVYSIVKLSTTCDNNKSTFYIKDHQNRSNIFHFFFTSRYTQDLLHNKKL